MKKRETLYLVFVLLLVTTILIVKFSYSTDDTVLTSDNFEIKSNTIYAIPTSNDFQVTELLENLNFSEVIDVNNASNNRISNSEPVGTGYKVKISNKSYTVIVQGDVNGDGKISLSDVSKLYNAYKGKATLTTNFLKAGRLTNNTNITIGDVSKLYNFYKGNSPFTYYSKDYPDGLTVTVNKTVNTVANLKTSNLSVGKIAQTKGYYTINDGGGAKYKIVSNSNQTIDNGKHIKLDNGNVAQLLIGKKTVNVKQFGAKGDGNTDDHVAFDNAVKSGATTIKIPNGTFNLNNNRITLSRYNRFVGNGEDKTIVKDGSFRSEYGVGAENITFDGGATETLDYVGTAAYTGKAVFLVTPNGTRDIHYKNCTFKNVLGASFARDFGNFPETTRIRNDIVEGCSFLNIGRTAIYNDLRMDYGSYTKNKFINIGTSDTKRGIVSAIFLGDITNNTKYEVGEMVITGNTFENMITQNNFDAHEVQQHIINANFIAIRGYKALIDNNTVTNLIGYGDDREGIYTKVRDLTISNNKLTNAGMGEGYVCAKPHDGEASFKIINNEFYGDAGTAIRDYGPGVVSGNKIYIQQTQTAFLGTVSDTVSSTNATFTMKNNIFECGTANDLVVGNETIENYSSNKLIRMANFNVPITIENNTFNPTTMYDGYIAIGNPGNSVTVKNNNFKLANNKGNTISVYQNKDGITTSLSNNTTVSGNTFEVGDQSDALARTQFLNTNGTATNRKFSFLNNIIRYNGSNADKTIKVVVAESASGNNDKLIVKGNTTNTTKKKTTITTSYKDYEIDDENFATISYKYES